MREGTCPQPFLSFAPATEHRYELEHRSMQVLMILSAKKLVELIAKKSKQKLLCIHSFFVLVRDVHDSFIFLSAESHSSPYMYKDSIA